MTSLMAIVGPTASGKSALALFLAERLGGEIVNYDSLQLYRHFDIGTAKPSEEERRWVPHHLLDVLEPAQVYSAGEYARQAAGVIRGILERGRLPVLAGGTGFYLRALLQGLFAGPQRDEQLRGRLRERARTRPGGYLHGLLRRLDPASAARIHANDTPKLIRAIEVSLRTRRPMSALFSEARGPSALAGIRAFKIGLDPPRRLLYERINLRTARMFQDGLVEEVSGILASGVLLEAKPFESVGYKEALAVVQQRITLAEAVGATQLRTRHYAKRQMTWFRRERDVRWLHAFGDDPAARQSALDWLLGELRVKS